MIASADLLAAERAVPEIRGGRPIALCNASCTTLYVAVETTRDSIIDHLHDIGAGKWSLILSAERALAMGCCLPAPLEAVALALPARPALRETAALATSRRRRCAKDAAHAAEPGDGSIIRLLKFAWLLPAALRLEVDSSRLEDINNLVEQRILHAVSPTGLTRMLDCAETGVERISEAQIPLIQANDARFVCFRTAFGHNEHLAILIGNPRPDPGVAVRLHSACLTGDVFGSLRCDCGEQLRQSVARLRELGGGVLLYLVQEGRGIGLANKLRAYALQDEGCDTIDADLLLGFSPDERRYGIAAAMLLALGYDRVRLLTNNPDKIEALQSAGITIVERLPLLAGITPQNRRYMDAKRTRARHLLEVSPEDGGGFHESC